MTDNELRISIYGQAVKGLLVKRIVGDGNGKSLIKQITELRRLQHVKGTRRKKIEFDKIKKSEKPFPIPSHWEWVRIEDIFKSGSGKTFTYNDTDGKAHEYLTTFNVQWNKILTDEIKTAYFTDDEVKKFSIQKGDLLVVEDGETGRSAVWEKDETIPVQNHILSLRPYGKTEPKFFIYVLYIYNRMGLLSSSNSGTQTYSKKKLAKTAVPLPPLNEQKRIVEKLERLNGLLDRLESEQDKLKDVRKKYRDEIERSVLDYALHGKLVKQDVKDGTAEELYNNTIRNYHIGKSPIIEPFAIPNSWKWFRICDIFKIKTGDAITSAYISDTKTKENPYPCYGGNGIRGYTSKTNGEKHSCCIIGRQGEDCGNVSFVNRTYFFSKNTIRLTPLDGIAYHKWTYYALKALNLNQYARATLQKGISEKRIEEVPIPLPPLNEQKRIVAQIEKILSVLE